MKLLVVYYSHDGNTKAYAERIAAEKGADIMELRPVKDIPDAMGKKMMQGGFLATFGLGTRLHSTGVSPLIYDEIILGTPIWAGKPCAAVNEFIKSFEVNEKVTSVFTLSGGGDNDKCMKVLKKKFPNLRNSVALADRVNTEMYPQNEEKIKSFIDAI